MTAFTLILLVSSLILSSCHGQQFSWSNHSLYRPLNASTTNLRSLVKQGVRSGGLPVEELQRRFTSPSPPKLLNEGFPGIPQSFFVEADKRLAAQASNNIDEPQQTASAPKDAPLDQVSNLARQLFNLPVANQQQLLSAVSSALGARQLGPLESVFSRNQPPADPFGPASANDPLLPVELFQTTAPPQALPPSFNPEQQLQQLPPEQRYLLQAAIRSGELSSDPKQLWPAINAIVSEHRATTAPPTQPVQPSQPAPNALEAYLRQYSRQTGVNPSDWLNVPTNSLPKGIFDQLGAASAPAVNFVPPTPLAPEKLPYYGKYCGSFIENRNRDSTRHYNVQGAVWVIDQQHLLVSKFVFQPAFFQRENITFWAGPNEDSGDAVEDMFPSENGIYLRPETVDLNPFLRNEKKTQIAKHPTAEQVSKIFNRNSQDKATDAAHHDNGSHAEPEPKAEPKPEPAGSLGDIADKLSKPPVETGLQVDAPQPKPEPEPIPTAEPRNRLKRDYFFPPRWPTNPEDLYGNPQNSLPQQPGNFGAQFSSDDGNVQRLPSRTVRIIVDGGMVSVAPSHLVKDDLPFNGDNTVFLPTLPPHLRPTTTLSTLLTTTEQTTTTSTTTTTTTSTTTETTAPSTAQSSTTEVQVVKTLEQKDEEYAPLLWYAGYQPLLLKLPNNKRVSDLHWLSIWDHDNDQAIASVLIPNGPGFKVPSAVSLRGLKSNGLRKVSSGPIEVVDTKTIKINDFFYEGDAPGAWFMVGKDLLPNPNGEILPILVDKTGTYDCDFLKPYNTQTVILKLPGDMEIKDVFWLSVYCVPYSISFAQVYLPYNDIHVPPDMSGQSAPYCVLETPTE